MPNERENYLCVYLFLFFLSVFFRHLLDLTVIVLIAGIIFLVLLYNLIYLILG